MEQSRRLIRRTIREEEEEWIDSPADLGELEPAPPPPDPRDEERHPGHPGDPGDPGDPEGCGG